MSVNNPKFSLIMATIGRVDEVNIFLHKLLEQDYPLDKIEVIIVDQNETPILENIILKFKENINIKHIKSSQIGLSRNRNIGIKAASGEILSFPDDDCYYYDNTLSSVAKILFDNNSPDMLLGRIYDRINHTSVIRSWPVGSLSVKKINFFSLYSSITIFTKNLSVLFDERLGSGLKYGSYEDADYIYESLERKMKIIYISSVEVMHPPLNLASMSPLKIYSYGLGFGAFCRKRVSTTIFALFMSAILFHSMHLFLEIIKFNQSRIKKRFIAIQSRIIGFFQFPK